MKVGDKVLVKTYKTLPNYWDFYGAMAKFMGRIVTIRSVTSAITIEEDCGIHFWMPENFIFLDSIEYLLERGE